jgi:hypothetical protein
MSYGDTATKVRAVLDIVDSVTLKLLAFKGKPEMID